MRLDACFNVRGLDESELVTDDNPVSITRSRRFAAGVEGLKLIVRSS